MDYEEIIAALFEGAEIVATHEADGIDETRESPELLAREAAVGVLAENDDTPLYVFEVDGGFVVAGDRQAIFMQDDGGLQIGDIEEYKRLSPGARAQRSRSRRTQTADEKKRNREARKKYRQQRAKMRRKAKKYRRKVRSRAAWASVDYDLLNLPDELAEDFLAVCEELGVEVEEREDGLGIPSEDLDRVIAWFEEDEDGDLGESQDLDDAYWSGGVKTKWHPPEGFFKQSADKIAKGLKTASESLKQAMSRLNFYINRAGKGLTKEDRGRLASAKDKLQALYADVNDVPDDFLDEELVQMEEATIKPAKSKALLRIMHEQGVANVLIAMRDELLDFAKGYTSEADAKPMINVANALTRAATTAEKNGLKEELDGESEADMVEALKRKAAPVIEQHLRSVDRTLVQAFDAAEGYEETADVVRKIAEAAKIDLSEFKLPAAKAKDPKKPYDVGPGSMDTGKPAMSDTPGQPKARTMPESDTVSLSIRYPKSRLQEFVEACKKAGVPENAEVGIDGAEIIVSLPQELATKLNDALNGVDVTTEAYQQKLEEQRGMGMGVGGPRQGDGGTDTCKCPECGATAPHQRGTPCTEQTCPKCGAKMVGAAQGTTGDTETPPADEAEGDVKKAVSQAKANAKQSGQNRYVNSTSAGIRVEKAPIKKAWAGNKTLYVVKPSGDVDAYESVDEASKKVQFKCNECGAKFKKAAKGEVTCPKCGSVDVYPTDYFGEAEDGTIVEVSVSTLIDLKAASKEVKNAVAIVSKILGGIREKPDKLKAAFRGAVQKSAPELLKFVKEGTDEASTHAVITKGKGSTKMRMGDQTAGEPNTPDEAAAIKKLKALAKKWGAKSIEVIEAEEPKSIVLKVHHSFTREFIEAAKKAGAPKDAEVWQDAEKGYLFISVPEEIATELADFEGVEYVEEEAAATA